MIIGHFITTDFPHIRTIYPENAEAILIGRNLIGVLCEEGKKRLLEGDDLLHGDTCVYFAYILDKGIIYDSNRIT